MKTIFTFLIAVFCCCNFAHADLTIVLNGDDSGRPAVNVLGEGTLPEIMRAAADTWEGIFASDTSIPDFTLTIDFCWGDLDSSIAEHDLIEQETINGIHRETAGKIVFNNTTPLSFVFADPTPLENSEYFFFNVRRTDIGGGSLTAERIYTGTVPGVASRGAFDLYSVALHEIGHALGLSSFNEEFLRETRTEGDDTVEVESPLPFAGSIINIEGDNAHLLLSEFPNALIAPVFRFSMRRLPSNADILAVAQISQFNAVDLDFLAVPEPVLGDVDLDGTVDFLDISPFIAVLSNGEFQNEADINLDGAVNFFDISPFIAILSGT